MTDILTQTHMPSSLLQICVKFVAEHIEYVDSLIGFPELIGEQLFKAVEMSGRLSTLNGNVTDVLMVFSDAYQDLLMDSLVIRSSTLFLENFSIVIQACFQNIKILDLHSCRIGDDHEMLEFIGNSSSLTHVGLCHNALSDVGIQKYTTPMRMFGRGPDKLKILDLSCNPHITDRSIRYLTIYKHIEGMDLSGTHISEVGVSKIEKSLLLIKDSHHAISKPLLIDYTTSGWASSTINKWLEQSKPENKMPQPKSSSAAASFYKRRKQRLEFAKDVIDINKRNEKPPPKDPKIVLKVKRLIPSLNIQAQSDCWKTKGPGYVCGEVAKSKNPFVLKDMNLCDDFTDHKKAFRTCRKSEKKGINLENAIELITQTDNDKGMVATSQDTNTHSRKRKHKPDFNSSCKSPLSKRKANFCTEEQDILSTYLRPIEQKGASKYKSLMEALERMDSLK